MNSDFIVSNGNYLVTGAASGIGKEVVKLLVNCSNTVLAVDKDLEKLNILRDEINSDSLVIMHGDITNSETRKNILLFPDSFDGVVNSAGIIKLVPFKYISEDILIELDKN